jgi:hypothetical protein
MNDQTVGIATDEEEKEREGRQTVWVLSYGDVSDIQHPPRRTSYPVSKPPILAYIVKPCIFMWI